MCPDRQLLSVYVDGELPSPWKEKMETHLAQCSGCKEQLENYRRLFVLSDETALHEKAQMEAAKDRVWQKLQSRRPGRRTRSFKYAADVWRRRVSIPLPAAAAAAVVLVLLAAFWMQRPAEPPAVIPTNIIASEEALPNIIPASSDMNGVLQYLGGFDSGDILILRLPESRNFISSGEPAIINAVDYPRR
jgi:anti-sigma-K factor RskA